MSVAHQQSGGVRAAAGAMTTPNVLFSRLAVRASHVMTDNPIDRALASVFKSSARPIPRSRSSTRPP